MSTKSNPAHPTIFMVIFRSKNICFEITKLCETHFSFILLMTNDPKWSDTIKKSSDICYKIFNMCQTICGRPSYYNLMCLTTLGEYALKD